MSPPEIRAYLKGAWRSGLIGGWHHANSGLQSIAWGYVIIPKLPGLPSIEYDDETILDYVEGLKEVGVEPYYDNRGQLK